jgi:serine/threonine-protein kinase
MNSDAWNKTKELLIAALALPEDARSSFLNQCDAEQEVRDEVARLLAYKSEIGTFLSQTVGGHTLQVSEAYFPVCTPGSILANRFRVIRFLSRGGMGEVYEAEDIELNRRVALKMVRPLVSGDPDCLQRFKREVKLAQQVTHPNVCRIFDFFRHSTTLSSGNVELVFVSMELLQGETLAERLQRIGKMEADEALRIISQVLSALEAAHAVGVLHRDLKPGNIFLVSSEGSNSCRAVVTDFGLALPLTEDSSPSVTPATGSGVLGTPAYMSPEQLENGPLTPASDIYALGLVMYHTAAGVLPSKDETPFVMAARRLNKRTPSPRRFVPEIDPLWESVIMKCLERDASRRFQSAGEIAKTLRREEGVVRLTHKNRRGLRSVAILPFINASGDSEMEYLSDGITETVINAVSRIPTIRVMARSTVFRFKGRLDNPQDIGRQLGVAKVVVGRVLPRGASLNVGAELIDVENGWQVWGEQFNRRFDDIFDLQEEIAGKISLKLEIKLGREERKRFSAAQTRNTEAYQLYLKGRYFLNKRTEADIKRSIEYFERAIVSDPRYALAYSGLADAHTTLAFIFPVLPPTEFMTKAQTAATKALSIDESLAEAYASLGVVAMRYEWRLGKAEAHFTQAIALNPSYATAHHWYGECLAAMGRGEESIDQLKRAQELDPLSAVINAVLAAVYYFSGNYERSIEQCRYTLELENNFWPAYQFLGMSYEARGELPQAIDALRRAVDSSLRSTLMLSALGHAYAVNGDVKASRGIYEELEQLSKVRYVSPLNLALIEIGLGDADRAFTELERAVQGHSAWLVFLRVDRRFDPLRADPRFDEIMRRVGFSGSFAAS